MSEIPKHIMVERVKTPEKIVKKDAFKMNSTCLQLYDEIEAMHYLTRIEKDALID